MRKKQILIPTLDNVLRLFSDRMSIFSGESKRGYQKAFSSFQVFSISNYNLSSPFFSNIIANWVIYNLLMGLSFKTVSFYLDKLASLYSKSAHLLVGGKLSIFKDIKNRLRYLSEIELNIAELQDIVKKIIALAEKNQSDKTTAHLIEKLKNFSVSEELHLESLMFTWGCVALAAGVPPDKVKGILTNVPDKLRILSLCDASIPDESELILINNKVTDFLNGGSPQWFAMRLRPRVNFEKILDRFAMISSEVNLPELFYPFEEIAKLVKRKVVWKGKPVIRDVIFFKTRKNNIFRLFNKIYDLAWCYRSPGDGIGNYAVIPSRAMDEFKAALGILGPDFQVEPAGEMKLKPGDEVVIVNGEYAQKHAKILKEAPEDMYGNKIFRVTLLNCNGRWDIGIDARLLKKT